MDGPDVQIQNIRIRLSGIDCPEAGQPYGKNAKRFLSAYVGTVRFVGAEKDRNGRLIAEIFGEHQTESINLKLVREGLAWHYTRFSDDEALAAAEQEAREDKRELWGGSHKPIAPWDWRKLSKEERDQFR